MVRDGLGDETGAKAIEQRGVNLAPTEDFLQSLKAAGANEAFLGAPPTQGRIKVAERAVRLSKVFGGSAESWLAQQAHYDLARLRADRIKVKRLQLA
jgi:hypothetical protein